MPVLEINFDEVPDKYVPIAPGIYDLLVDGIPEIGDNRDKTGKVVICEFIVQSEGEFKGRKHTERISTKMTTQLKNLAQSAGIHYGQQGFDTADLNGRIVKASIVSNPYTDKNGVSQEGAKIKEFLVTQS